MLLNWKLDFPEICSGRGLWTWFPSFLPALLASMLSPHSNWLAPLLTFLAHGNLAESRENSRWSPLKCVHNHNSYAHFRGSWDPLNLLCKSIQSNLPQKSSKTPHSLSNTFLRLVVCHSKFPPMYPTDLFRVVPKIHSLTFTSIEFLFLTKY